MKTDYNSRNTTGFTLIELLIVITVIAILALIVIPRLAGANKRAMDSTLKANVVTLRKAVEVYHADTGLFPLQILDLVEQPAQGVDVTGATVGLMPDTWKGPYLRGQGGLRVNYRIPRNPYVGSGASVNEHWTIETRSVVNLGNVSFPTPSSSTLDWAGDPYSTY